MDKSELANFILFMVDIAITVSFGMVVYGVLKGRIYQFGSWYYKSNASKYYQCLVGYLIGGLVFLYFRFFIFPESLFKHL